MPDLVLENIEKYYGAVHAVKGVSLDINAGEFVVLVGPSGCGKSTLLRSIAGLEEISSGDIVLGGRSIARLAPRDRDIAMVFQNYALYPYLTVFENIAFGLRARKVGEGEIQKKVGWAAELLDIEDYLQRHPRELSGGQRQRVAIGRAIVRDADLFLLDEPLSNLDAKLRDGMREELKRLHQRLGKTFIYVTHDQIEAMTLADRIVLLNGGEISQSGSPLELYEQPKNVFVAGFLGSPTMNILSVKLDKDKKIFHLPDGQSLPLSDRQAGKLDNVPDDVLWGIRPEYFTSVEAGDTTIEAKMEVIQPTGSRTFGSFTIGETHMIAELDPHAATSVGQNLNLAVAIDRTTFFDPQSKQTVV